VLDQYQVGFSYVFVTAHVRSVSRTRFDANLTLLNICVLDQDQVGFSYVFVTDHVRYVSRTRFM